METHALTTLAGMTIPEQFRDQIDVIKQIAAPNTSDAELATLIHMAATRGLDPLTRQIVMIVRKQQGRSVATPMVTIDGLRAIADRTGQYAPGRVPTFEYDEKGVLIAATAYLMKLVAGRWMEVAAVAYMHEFMPEPGKDFMWQRMPHHMLAKCAEALALRRAFPAQMSGLYTNDELGVKETETITDISDMTFPPPKQGTSLPVTQNEPEEVHWEVEDDDPEPPRTPIPASEQQKTRLKVLRDGMGLAGIKKEPIKQSALSDSTLVDAIIDDCRRQLAERGERAWDEATQAMTDDELIELATLPPSVAQKRWT